MWWNWWTKMRKWIPVKQLAWNNDFNIPLCHHPNLEKLSFSRMYLFECRKTVVQNLRFELWVEGFKMDLQNHAISNISGEIHWVKKAPLICSPAPIYVKHKLKQDRNCAFSTPTDCRKVKISYFICPETTFFDRWKLPGSQLENYKNVFLPYCLNAINGYFRVKLLLFFWSDKRMTTPRNFTIKTHLQPVYLIC